MPSQGVKRCATTDHRTTQPADSRLQQLLAVEKRLEDLVRAAEVDAATRIAAARAAREERLAAASTGSARADAERARVERAAHEQALLTIEADHRDALAAITDIPDSRIDDLARWVVAQAIGVRGEPA